MSGKELLTLVKYLEQARSYGNIGLVPHLYGPSGSGKTTLAILTAKEMEEELKQEVPVLRLILSASFFEVIRGIPRFEVKRIDDKDVTVTYDSLPEWFAIAASKPSVILMDEVDKDPEKLAAVLDVIDCRTMHGVRLHPRTVLILSSQPWLSDVEHQSNIYTNTQQALITRSVFVKTDVANVVDNIENEVGIGMDNIRSSIGTHLNFDIPRLSDIAALCDMRRLNTLLKVYRATKNTDDEWVYKLLLDQFPQNVRTLIEEDIHNQKPPVRVRSFIQTLSENPINVWAINPIELMGMMIPLVQFGTIDTFLMVICRVILDSTLSEDHRVQLFINACEAWKYHGDNQTSLVFAAEGEDADPVAADKRMADVLAVLCRYAYDIYYEKKYESPTPQQVLERGWCLPPDLLPDFGKWRCPKLEETKQSSSKKSKK